MNDLLRATPGGEPGFSPMPELPIQLTKDLAVERAFYTGRLELHLLDGRIVARSPNRARLKALARATGFGNSWAANSAIVTLPCSHARRKRPCAEP